MIISRTPFRISFAGGGSDMPDYYRQKEGAVLSVSIQKYMYLSMHEYFAEDRYFLKYSQSELVDSVECIQHRIIRETFRKFNIKGVDFNSSSDIPAGTGMGSSSSFTVGLVNLCHAYRNNRVHPGVLAETACNIEINQLKEPIGKQDQYAAAFGGLNLITFHEDEGVTVSPVEMKKSLRAGLEYNLQLYYLGQTRTASSVLSQQKDNIRSSNKVVHNLDKMVALAHELKQELTQGNIESMGDILHRGWIYKKELANGISNPQIDHYYQVAREHGALGGKLLGAGGSGFLLFYVPQSRHDQVRHALADLREYPVEFDNTGSIIVDLIHLPQANFQRRISA